MKLNNLTPIVLSAAALCAGSISLSAATSGVVGATATTIPSGPTIISVPYLKAVDFQGAVSVVSGADLDMGSAVPVPVNASYVHVLDGADQGRVIDISSVAGNVITLASAPAGLLAGDTIAVREHMTLNDLGSNVPNFTTVTFLEPGGTQLVATKLISGWNIGGGTVILPGEGFVINNGLAFVMTVYGSVSEDDVIFEKPLAGPAIVGFIDPVNGAVDVVNTVAAGVPNFSTVTYLNPGGTQTVATKLISGWNTDPNSLDYTGYKSMVVNTGAGLDIVNAGNVIAP